MAASLWADFLVSLNGMSLDWLRLGEVIAGVLVAGGTLVLALRTAQMADKTAETAAVAARQLEWFAEQDREARHPRIHFAAVNVQVQQAYDREGGPAGVALRFEARGLANLGAYAIVVDGLRLKDESGRVLARGRLSRVIPPGSSWTSRLEAPSSEDQLLAIALLHGATEDGVDHIETQANHLDLTFRSGSDPNRSYVVSLRRADLKHFWLAFRGHDASAQEIQADAD